MNGSKFFRNIAWIFGFFFLVSCQSTKPDEALRLDQENQPAIAQTETFGVGDIRVYMIVNRSGDLSNNRERSDYPAGAALGVEYLANNDISMIILDAKSDKNLYHQHLTTAMQNAAKLIITGADQQLNESVAGLVQDKSIPIISLSDVNVSGTYAFLPNGWDSLSATLDFAIDQGKNKLAVVYPEGINTEIGAVMNQTGKRRDFNFVEVTYPKGVNATALVNQNMDYFKSANCIVLASKDNDVSVISREIRKAADSGAMFISRSDIPPALIASPALDGVFMASTDLSALSSLNQRLQQEGKPPLDANSAYAFDVIAMMAGIIRTFGKKGITKANLHKGSGFKGTTGAFKFHPDGRVERLLEIGQIKSGRLQKVQSPPPGF